MKKILTFAALAVLLSLSAHAGNYKHNPKATVRLTIATPEATERKIVRRKDFNTYRYRNRVGALATTQWPLTFRIETRNAVGFVAKATADERTRARLALFER
jgi:hypothetical protein